MDSKLFTVAESAVVDQFSHRVSIFNIMDEFSSPSYPVAITQLTVIGMFVRLEEEPEEYDFRLRMKMKDKKELLLDTIMKVNFQGALNTTAIGNLPGFVFPTPGLMNISISIERKKYGSWDIAAKDSTPKFEIKSVPKKIEKKKPALSKKKKH